MKKFIILLIAAPLFFIGCENPCVDVVCDQGLAQEDANGLCFCDCIEGFTGEKCDQAIVDDPCEDITCENDGTCIDGTCDCPDGFSGDNCQDEDLCFGVACTNNGVFVTTDGVCTCECNDGFGGDDCSIEIITEITGNWSAEDQCETYMYTDSLGNILPTFPYFPTINQDEMGAYTITNFGGFDPNLAFGATLEDNIITVPPAFAGDDYSTTIEGMGTFSETGDTILWNYNVDTDGIIDSCSGIWIKL